MSTTISVVQQNDNGSFSRVELDVPEGKASELFFSLSQMLLNKVGNPTVLPKVTSDSEGNTKATFMGLDVSNDCKVESSDSTEQEVKKITDPVTTVKEEKKSVVIQNTEAESEKDSENFEMHRAVKGFVALVCPKCGKETVTNLKTPQDDFQCRECGKEFNISETVVPCIFHCECGKSFHYLTNHEETMFDITCINCGMPNTVEYNKRKNQYRGVKNK